MQKHFRKKKNKTWSLFSKWKLNKPALVFCLGGWSFCFVSIEEKSNLKTFCLSRFLVSLSVSFSVSLMQLCLQLHALAMQSRF